MSDPEGDIARRENQIRNNERHRIAHLLEQHGDAIVEYLNDPRDAVQLIAYLLRLQDESRCVR